MKKLLAFVIIVGIAGFAVYKFGMDFASDKVMNQLTTDLVSKEDINKLLEDPDVQRFVKQELGEQRAQAVLANVKVSPSPSPATSDAGNETATPPSPNSESKLRFSSKEEAFNFLLDKFSLSEMKNMASLAKGGLTNEEKVQLKNEVSARLSTEEMDALKVFGLIELLKDQQ